MTPGWAKAEATSKIPLKGLFVVVVLKLTKQSEIADDSDKFLM